MNTGCLGEGVSASEISEKNHQLSNPEIDRYSRQLLLSDFGVDGQLLLKQSSVLIVGLGGLGCPSSLYLAGSGVGHIGLVDYDVVEANNLHRQIIHTTQSIGKAKVNSAAAFLRNINPLVSVSTYPVLLDNSNALEIISKFDVIIDATDNVPTRYLLNDTCVLLSKPLVSGSALQMEGQLTIYNYKEGPCYRCIFPVPPPPEAVTNCSDGGVLGVIPGTIGVLQALEAIKIILNQTTISGYLLIFNGCDTSFRKIKLRGKSPFCEICGNSPTITKLINYEQFCQSKSNDKNPHLTLLPFDKRVTVREYNAIKNTPHVLIDVRYQQEFAICKLDKSVNIPVDKIDFNENLNIIEKEISKHEGDDIPIFVICRRGNDSQRAVLQLEKKFPNKIIKDIIGGLHSWAKEVDTGFPVY